MLFCSFKTTLCFLEFKLIVFFLIYKLKENLSQQHSYIGHECTITGRSRWISLSSPPHI